VLEIRRRNRVAAGGGSVKGAALPGCPVTIDVRTPGIEMVDPPAPGNNNGVLRLKNTFGAADYVGPDYLACELAKGRLPIGRRLPTCPTS